LPDVAAMIPIADLRTPAVIELAERSERFLVDHGWCREIEERYLAWAIAPQTGVFFFRIIPAFEDVDRELWVIVGDLPPAYIVCDNAETWQEALDAYAFEMMKWVEAVRKGQSVADIIPVNVEPTAEHATMLETRINLIAELFVNVPPETLPTDI
jgi:hypothetical protein